MSHASNVIDALPESDYPTVLVDALAFQSSASELLDSVKAEQAPDLNSATLKTLTKAHAAAVEFDLAHDAKVKHAEVLVKIAHERTSQAEMRAAILSQSSSAELFDDAAKVLLDLIAKRGGVDPTIVEMGSWSFDPELAELREALADVARLGHLRDDHTFLAGGGQVVNPPISNIYEKHSRTALLPDANTSQILEAASSRFGWRGPGYILVCAQTPGVVVRWQTSDEQHAQPAPAAIARSRANMAANFEATAKARGTARRIA
jgi:hypothetical protein